MFVSAPLTSNSSSLGHVLSSTFPAATISVLIKGTADRSGQSRLIPWTISFMPQFAGKQLQCLVASLILCSGIGTGTLLLSLNICQQSFMQCPSLAS